MKERKEAAEARKLAQAQVEAEEAALERQYYAAGPRVSVPVVPAAGAFTSSQFRARGQLNECRLEQCLLQRPAERSTTLLRAAPSTPRAAQQPLPKLESEAGSMPEQGSELQTKGFGLERAEVCLP